jgi:glycosyltransferase involved in cell wall biosynthesis
MKLSIITINWNNADGLEKTMRSVVKQNEKEFEYVVVDGGSTDESVEVIKKYALQREIVWSSERDNGIYNGMNKGIQKARGEYIMILNSGDYLADDNVVGCLLKSIESDGYPSVYYGNIIKIWPDGKTLIDHQIGGEISMISFYSGTLNPDGAMIKKSLFEKYGYFDENMKICSDWAWLMNVLALHGETSKRCSINTIYFDMTGVSEGGEKSLKTIKSERRQVLEKALPAAVLADYDKYATDIRIMQRIRRHKGAYKLVYLIERTLFKMEKRNNL